MNGDIAQAAQLHAEAKNWAEGGTYRIAAHAAAGALGGGLAGALGATASAALMPTIAGEINKLDLPEPVRLALATAAAAGVGAIAGGASGAASAFNVDFNNRQLTHTEKEHINKLAGNDSVKKDRLISAACVLTNCAAEYPSDSPQGLYYLALQERGATYFSELANLKQMRNNGFLLYTPSDKANDFLKQSIANTVHGLKQSLLTAGDALDVLGSGIAGLTPQKPKSELGQAVVENGAGSTVAVIAKGTVNTIVGAINGNTEDIGKIIGGAIVGEIAWTATKFGGKGVADTLTIKPVVTAEGKIGDFVFRDVNQTARPIAQADANQSTLISDRVAGKAESTGKNLPNGNMADAHAEIGVIQQAYNAGKTQGKDMSMVVKGKDVCGYCQGDIAAAAQQARLKSLTVQAIDDLSGMPKTYGNPPSKKTKLKVEFS